MADASLRMQRSIGEPLRPTAARRRETLFSAVPKIEEYYKKLKRLSLPELDSLSPEARSSALELYNKAVVDGRYIDLLQSDPKRAAEKLAVKIDPRHWAAIETVAGRIRNPAGPVEGPVEAVIAVVVVIACAKPAEGVVIDESGMVSRKL